MDSFSTLRILLSRWYVVVPCLLLTAAATVLALRAVAPTFDAKGTLVLLPPATEQVAPENAQQVRVNPWLNIGLDRLANILSQSASSNANIEQIQTKGATASFEVTTGTELDAPGSGTSPIINIVANDADPAVAQQTVTALFESINTELQQRQQEQRVPAAQLIKTEPITTPQSVTTQVGNKMRAAAAAFGIGISLTFGLAFMAESMSQRRASADRRNYRNTMPPGGMRSPVEGHSRSRRGQLPAPDAPPWPGDPRGRSGRSASRSGRGQPPTGMTSPSGQWRPTGDPMYTNPGRTSGGPPTGGGRPPGPPSSNGGRSGSRSGRSGSAAGPPSDGSWLMSADPAASPSPSAPPGPGSPSPSGGGSRSSRNGQRPPGVTTSHPSWPPPDPRASSSSPSSSAPGSNGSRSSRSRTPPTPPPTATPQSWTPGATSAPPTSASGSGRTRASRSSRRSANDTGGLSAASSWLDAIDPASDRSGSRPSSSSSSSPGAPRSSGSSGSSSRSGGAAAPSPTSNWMPTASPSPSAQAWTPQGTPAPSGSSPSSGYSPNGSPPSSSSGYSPNGSPPSSSSGYSSNGRSGSPGSGYSPNGSPTSSSSGYSSSYPPSSSSSYPPSPSYPSPSSSSSPPPSSSSSYPSSSDYPSSSYSSSSSSSSYPPSPSYSSSGSGYSPSSYGTPSYSSAGADSYLGNGSQNGYGGSSSSSGYGSYPSSSSNGSSNGSGPDPTRTTGGSPRPSWDVPTGRAARRTDPATGGRDAATSGAGATSGWTKYGNDWDDDEPPGRSGRHSRGRSRT